MRTASLVLGIVGGALALIWVLFFTFIFVSIDSIQSDFDYEDSYTYDDADSMLSQENGVFLAQRQSMFTDPAFAPLIAIGVAGLIGGGLGIAGGIIVRKRNVAAGVMLIVAALLCVMAFFISTICLILAAIFAFIKEKPKPVYPPYGYYPPPPYYYPPYGAPYNPQYYSPVQPMPYPAQNTPPPGPETDISGKPQG